MFNYLHNFGILFQIGLEWDEQVDVKSFELKMFINKIKRKHSVYIINTNVIEYSFPV